MTPTILADTAQSYAGCVDSSVSVFDTVSSGKEVGMKVTRLSSVTIRTTDHDATAQFFHDVLGLTVEQLARDVTVLRILDGTTVEVNGTADRDSDDLIDLVPTLLVDDLASAARELHDRGVEIVATTEHGVTRTWLSIRGPDGLVIKLSERAVGFEGLVRPETRRESALRRLGMVTGTACLAIGVYHAALGVASVPGEGSAGPTVDSRERFYNVIFAGYGLAWMGVAGQRPLPLRLIRGLAALFFAGGVGRLLSILVHGKPHWFQLVLTGIEMALPPVYLELARRAEQDRVAGDRES